MTIAMPADGIAVPSATKCQNEPKSIPRDPGQLIETESLTRKTQIPQNEPKKGTKT